MVFVPNPTTTAPCFKSIVYSIPPTHGTPRWRSLYRRLLEWCAIQHFLSMSTRDPTMSWPMGIRHVEYSFRTNVMVLCQTPPTTACSIQYCTTANSFNNNTVSHQYPWLLARCSVQHILECPNRDFHTGFYNLLTNENTTCGAFFFHSQSWFVCVKPYDNHGSVQNCTPSNFFTNTLACAINSVEGGGCTFF